MVIALSSVLQLVRLHTERDWFLPTGPVKMLGSLCDGSVHSYLYGEGHIYIFLND